MRTRLSGLAVMAALVTLVCLPSLASAQTSAGVVGGVNVSNIDFSADGIDVNFKQRTGVVVGAFVRRDFREGLGLQLEGLFSQKGTKTSEFFLDDEDETVDFEIIVNYLEIPVLLHATLPAGENAKVRLFGGPAFAFKMSSTQKVNGDEVDVDEDEVKSSDVGITVGGGLLIKKFVIDIRYTFGVLNVNDAPDDDDITIKNRTFAFMVGWQFK